MLNPESQPDFKEIEQSKELTEKEIKEQISEIKAIVLPLYSQIEKLRKENPHREVGGYIKNGKIELVDESQWEEKFVIGESFEKEREMGKQGIIAFHTHPDDGLPYASGQDILAAAFGLKELIFHKDGVIFLIAQKELHIEKILEIDKQVWLEAQKQEEKCGDPAYWFWKSEIKNKLGIRIINLINKEAEDIDQKNKNKNKKL